MIALLHRAGTHRLQVGTGTWLGHGNGADDFAGTNLRQPVFLLRFGTGFENVMGDDVAQADPQATAERTHGLHDTGIVGNAATSAAVLLGHIRQDQPQLTGLEPR
ncbi:hypothetical protein D3C81_1232070 [compost metagenome]